MVDTIVLRIHDLRKHHDLVKFVNVNFNGSSKHTAIISQEDADELRKSPIVDDKLMVDYFRNSKTGTHLVRYKSQDRLNSSGHYYFHAFENRDRDYLEFNFSVPKYKWGTNILVFARHMWDKDFVFYNHSSLKYNLDESFDLIISFIRTFFLKEFSDQCKIDYSCVEVNRIDLAYNQVFRSKENALEYLEYQKQIRRKHSRSDIRNFREYETSLMYITKRYSLKIYHKGSEYVKSDRREHEKINKVKGYEYFKVRELQNIADRILRYEVTLRSSMLSYLYNNNVFRRKCPIHKSRYEIYKKVESIEAKNERITERIRLINDPGKQEKYRIAHPYYQIDPKEKRVHKSMKKLILHERQFMVKVDEDVEKFNGTSGRYDHFEPRAKFSKVLFKECSKFFIEFIKEFQVSEKPSLSTVSDRINDYNTIHYKKLPKNEMMKFYELLQSNSFDEIKRKKLYSKATFYRYLKRFEDIGITKNNAIVLDHISVPVDLREYHSMFFSRSIIFNYQRLCVTI
jgi:hypothetical protein